MYQSVASCFLGRAPCGARHSSRLARRNRAAIAPLLFADARGLRP